MAVLQATSITGGLTMHGMAAGFMKVGESGSVTMDTNTYATTSALSSYLALTGGTMTGTLAINSGGVHPLAISSGQRYQLQVRNTNNSINSGYGWWWFMDTNFNMGFHADGAADRLTLTRDGNFSVSGTISTSSNIETTSGSSYIRVSGISSGSYIEISGNLPGYSNGVYPVIKSGGTIHFANNGKYSAYLEANDTYFGIMNSSQSTKVLLHTNGASYLTGGVVGIGLNNPSSGDRLEVVGTLRVHTGNNWDAIQIYTDGANGYIQGLGDETGLRIRSEYGNVLLADNRGVVGIGTSSPTAKLHVYTGNPSGSTGLAGDTAIAIDSSGNQFLEFRTSSSSSGIMQGLLFTDNGRNAFIGFKEYTGAAAATYGESIQFAIYDYSGSDAGSGFWWGTTTNAVNGITSPLMFLRSNGNLNVGFGSDNGFRLSVSGTGYASNDFRAPIFYDSDNTSYYVDPASTSNLNATYIGGHYYSSYNGYNIRLLTANGGGSASGILLQDGSGNFRIQLYGDGTNYGFLNGNWASWDMRKVNGGNLYLNNQSTYYLSHDVLYTYRVYGTADMRSPIYYDLDDTTYYGDFASTSRIASLNMGYTGGQVYNTAGGGFLYFNAHGESDIQAYCIGTTLENYGGNYTKLTIDHHTGIKIGASTSYGGIRFYSNSVKYYGGSLLFSVGEGDSNVRVTNNLYMGGNLVATQSWVTSQGYVTGGPFVQNVLGDSGAYDLNTSGQQAFFRFSTGGWVNGPTTGNYSHVLSVNGATDNRTVQIYLGDVPGYLWWRPNQGGTWHGWERILTSYNYNSWAPTLTGGGASGTWGINITGTAGSETLGTVTNRGNVATGDIYVPASTHFRARYTSNDTYHASLNWYGLQLGNNGDNYIIAGRTAIGGQLRFYVNNTTNFTSIDGTLSAVMFASGRTTFGNASDYGYMLNVAGSFFATDWIRVNGTSGFYFESYGGGWRMIDTTWVRSYNDKNVYTGGDIRVGGQFQLENGYSYWQRYGTWSSSLHRIAYMSFDWDGSYNTYSNHGIASTDLNGSFTDSMSINSFNDINLRLDSNNNNGDSYVRFHNDTTGANTFAWVGFNGSNYAASFSRDIYIQGNTGGSYGNRLIVGGSSTPYTLQDGNIRPTIYMTGAYPVLAINHTVTSNANHGPTIQFTFDGLSNRQWVIGCGGSGTFMDFGFSNSSYGNSDFNPHNGISGYTGNTIMRIIDNAVGIGGDWGTYGSGSNPSYTLDVRGTIYSNTDMRAPIFYDSANTAYYCDPASTSVLNTISSYTIYNTSLGSGYYFTAGDWGWRHQTPSGWIQFGPANSGHAHIYTDRSNFYFNVDVMYQNGNRIYGDNYRPYADSAGNADTTDGYHLNQNVTTSGSPSFSSVSGGDVYTTSGWFRNHTNNNGIYWSSTGWHLMPADGSDFRIHSGNSSATALRMETNGATRGYVYANSSNEIGILNSSRSWGFRMNNSLNAFIHGQTLTINADNAGWSSIYMNDGDQGMREIHCNSDRIGFLTQGGSWGAYLDDGTNWYAEGSMRAPIFYDSNDTNYYVDPNSSSRVYHIHADYLSVGQGINTSYRIITNGDYYANGGGNYWAEGRFKQYRGSGTWWNVIDEGNYSNFAIPISGGINMTGSYGLNDSRLYLRTNGDTNHYLWNASDDWEELGAYAGTGFRVTSNNGANGLLYVYGSSNGGYTYSPYSFRAPIFYDSDDTGYYLDPNGTSELSQLTTGTRARWGEPRIWTNRQAYVSDQGYWTGTNGWGTSEGTWANAWKGGFSGWDIWGSNSDHPQGSGYIHAQGIVSGQHYSTSAVGYGWMIVGAADATANRYWLRGKWDVNTSSWTEMMTSNNNPYAWNMNQYVRTSDNVEFNGVTVRATITVGSWGNSSSIYMTDGDEGTREIHCNSNRVGFLNQSGSWGSWCDDTGNWRTDHAMYASNWFRSYGYTGLYNEDYGSHIRPTANASHGTWEIFGYNKGGYAGLNIYDPGGYNNNYMHEYGNGGLYQQNGYGWIFYWYRPNSCLGIGTSTTSSSYRMYVNGGIYATDDIVAYSDRRKKTDIVTIDNALDKVTNLRGVFYTKIGEEDKGRKTGVIAQEINEVLPEVVTYAADVDEYGVSYGNIAGVLIEAIKEQNELIKTLKSEIDELKARLN